MVRAPWGRSPGVPARKSVSWRPARLDRWARLRRPCRSRGLGWHNGKGNRLPTGICVSGQRVERGSTGSARDRRGGARWLLDHAHDRRGRALINGATDAISGAPHAMDETAHATARAAHARNEAAHAIDKAAYGIDEAAHAIDEAAHAIDDAAHVMGDATRLPSLVAHPSKAAARPPCGAARPSNEPVCVPSPPAQPAESPPMSGDPDGESVLHGSSIRAESLTTIGLWVAPRSRALDTCRFLRYSQSDTLSLQDALRRTGARQGNGVRQDSNP